ncbi:MAG: PfkB family carbohydrate kinase [Pseudomonadota bacterium]
MTTVVGGVYAERCIEPFWDDVYGSGGRAAAAICGELPDVKLVTYRARALGDGIENLKAAYGLAISGPEADADISFEYVHSLADPRITPRPDAIPRLPELEVDDDTVLRFGMMEGGARVRARRAVYDPQSAFDPRPFAENGSSVEELALILNRLEARRLTGADEPAVMLDRLLGERVADVVVLKMGAKGLLVGDREERGTASAYKSDIVWKIGSGDVFSAAFTLFWAIEGRPPSEAADLSSRATSFYCGTRSLPFPAAHDLRREIAEPVAAGEGRIYLAAPFFNLAERWLVDEIRAQLLLMGVEVFSPLHDVGPGPADFVAPRDLEGLDRCQSVLAVLNGGDAGTIFEVGYAVARGIPVVVLAQNVRSEDLKMPVGSGCRIVEDMVSAIYHAVWSLG